METSSPEVERGIYLVEGNNWDFLGSGNEFPGSRKWYLPGNNWDFPGVETNFSEVEKGIYLVDGKSWDFPGSGKSYLPVNI